MKAAFLMICGALPLVAQDIAPKDSERDPVLSQLLESTAVETDGEAITLEPEPVLVTGNPPEDAELVEDKAAAPDPEGAEEEAPAEAEPGGVSIEVEGGASFGGIDAAEIELLAPFPAKPLDPPPAGWRLVHPDGVRTFSEKVKLANGTEIQLSIRPHLLVPDADGSSVFALSEPGYDAALGYDQQHTIGSILADSINEMDSNRDRLDGAARRLSELLDSLPPPPTVATENPEESP